MIETLRQSDFDTTMLDMWAALVEKAIIAKILPEDTKVDDVDEIEVQVTGAFLK